MSRKISVAQIAMGFFAGFVVSIFTWNWFVSTYMIYTSNCIATIATTDSDFGVLAASYAYQSVDDALYTEVLDVKHFEPVPGSASGYAKVAVAVYRSDKKDDRFVEVSVNSCGLILDYRTK